MASHDYHFITYWRVRGTVVDVYDTLVDALGYPRWWPEVYLSADVINRGDASGAGASVNLLTKGKLPYRLRWTAELIEATPPDGFSIEARGDFVGRGVWTFSQVAGEVQIVFDWQLRAEKPLLRWLSFALKPVFVWNHRWAMRKGEAALVRELKRRREVRLEVVS